MFVLVIFTLFLLVVGVGGGITYIMVRRLYREQKNYERGLKMVPLLIHLPPPSQDVQSNGRDARDIVDENISRAQVLYNILTSSVQKGFKSRFYGQRHLALEIVAQKGEIHLYTAVPISLLSLVEQAIVSAYPSAKLEEVAEPNIFNPLAKSSDTYGGEMSLKENFAYPIGTYQDIKRDSMEALLNALSTLQDGDGAAIQFLLRPADNSWRKSALSIAEQKRTGKSGSKGGETVFKWLIQVFTALTKPPEPVESKSPDKDVSTLDQSIVQSIEEKTKQPGFEVLIRLVASSEAPQRAQAIVSNVVASFALFDAPGKNGFKFSAAKDQVGFISSFILRLFPQDIKGNILNSTELSTIFHFPDQSNIPTTQLERQASKQVDGPRNIPEKGLLLGYNLFRGDKKPIRLSANDRRRHLYVVGQTGTGKSWLLQNLAIQDILDGRGFAFVDPHGDAVDELLAKIPRERAEDVIYFNPGDMDNPLGLNMFEYQNPDQKDFIIQEVIQMLYKLYDPQHQGIIGPRYEHIFRNAALAVMADPKGGTFIDIPKLFRDPQFLRDKLKYVTDQNVLDYWQKEYPASQRSQEAGDIISWFVSKFGAFMSNEMMRNIIGQPKSSFNLRQVMDEGKILLINLSRGRTGELNSKLLGMIFVMKFQAAAMSRADIDESERKDFSLYVDEFQNFSTDSFADILSEARKYRLNLIVANQFTTQLSDEIRDAVFGNVGSLVVFRVGTADAEFLAKQLAPAFNEDDLQFLPNANTIVRMLIDGVPTQPFSMATIPLLGSPNPKLPLALKQLSAAKYGRPRKRVESEIFERMATNAPQIPTSSLQPQLGATPARRLTAPNASQMPPVSSAARPSTGSSFLDEWLAKRKVMTPPTPTISSQNSGAMMQPQSKEATEGHLHIQNLPQGEEKKSEHILKIDNR